jgi:hypothetical protein
MKRPSKSLGIPNFQVVPVFSGPDEEEGGVIPLPGHRQGERGKNPKPIHHIPACGNIEKHGVLHPGGNVPGRCGLGWDASQGGREKTLLLGKDVGRCQRSQTETKGRDRPHHKPRNVTNLRLLHRFRSKTKDPETVRKLYYRKSFEGKIPGRGEKGGAIHIKGKVVKQLLMHQFEGGRGCRQNRKGLHRSLRGSSL